VLVSARSPSMDHSQFRKHSALYVAEVLDDPLLSEFRRHLGNCPDCQNEVAYWNRGLDAFEDIRRFVADQYARRHQRWVITLLIATLVLGMLIGAAGVAAYLMPRASPGQVADRP